MTQWHGGMHWSYANVAWAGFFAPLPSGQWVLRHELTWYHTVPEIAALDIIRQRKALGEHRWLGMWAQADLFPAPEERGETISHTFLRSGVPLQRASDNRLATLARLRSWLEPLPLPDGTVGPSLVVHPDCKHFIRTLPSLQQDAKNPEDVAENPDEFPALGAGYFVMSRPMRLPNQPPPLPPDAIGHEVEALRRAARRRV